jgi:hypothetical protein
METPEIPSHSSKSAYPISIVTSIITRTRIKTWEPTALPIGFAGLRYPEVSSYLMTTKGMMDHRNPSHGYLTTCKIPRYSGASWPHQYKVYNYI